MTEALCGPSNPLQNFQKHTSTDRSLQQDRLISRHAQAAQGFRSQANGNAGLLDPEFEAFQAGMPLDPNVTPHDPHHHLRHQQFYPQPNPAQAGWAADFAKLQIASPPPPPAMAFQQPPASASWHQDFRAQYSQHPAQQNDTQWIPPQQTYGSSMTNFNVQRPMGYIPSPSLNEQESSEARWKGKGRWQAESVPDMEAFEREFDALRDEMAAQEETLKPAEAENARVRFMGLDETNQANYAISEKDYAQSFSQHDVPGLVSQDPQTALREEPTTQESERGPAETDEDLARTAGILLENVSDNTTEKFQQSNFLALMRQFRDRVKRIDGNDVVDVGAESTTLPSQQQDADVHRHGPRPSEQAEMMGALPVDGHNNSYISPGGHAVDDFAADFATDAGGPPGDPGNSH